MNSFRVVLCLLLAGLAARAQEQWLARPSGVTVPLWGVAYGAGQWVVVGEQGTILTSSDGLAWTKRDSGFPARWLTAVTYANGLWVAVGGTAPASDRLGLVLISYDGVSWVPRVTAGARLNNIAYGNGVFVAVRDLGGTRVSLDGLAWSEDPSTVDSYVRGLAYGPPLFAAAGLTGLSSTFNGSPSFLTGRFTASTPIEAIAYGREQFLAVGTAGGLTLTSRDGLTW
ncbi:MAG: hypothetical protein NTV51_02985, partial [Verrucomicrobia bacterium]|nr:hypothetical protein [Verrucomicrobiota bacterium]